MERRDCQRVLAYTVGPAPYAAHQRRLMDEYATTHELEIVGERTDPVRHGAGLLDALRALDAGEADGLLVFDLRRIARTTSDLEALATPHRFLVAVLGEIDTRRPEGRYLATISARLLHDEPARPLRVRDMPATASAGVVWQEAAEREAAATPPAAPVPLPAAPAGLRGLLARVGGRAIAPVPAGTALAGAPARHNPVPSPTTSRS